MIVCDRSSVCRSAVLDRARMTANTAISCLFKTSREAEREGPAECAISEYTANQNDSHLSQSRCRCSLCDEHIEHDILS